MYNKMAMKRITILGIPIDDVTRRGAVERIQSLIHEGGQHQVATPNPEMLVAARKNPQFKSVLQSTTLNIPDGMGLIWVSYWLLGNPLTERVTGTDVMHDLCRLQSDIPIFLLGAANGVAEEAAKKLTEENPALQIVGTYAGSPKAEDEAATVQRINASGAQLLFVAYGAPAQELWIARNLPKMPDIKVAMGVGGAFDFLSGKQKRAPRWMHGIGLEWLWRLLRQPSRIGRIWNAVVVFPLLVLTRNKY